MKIFYHILIVLCLISCTQVRYINKPINAYPCIGLNNGNKILVAKDEKLKAKNLDSDKCIDGLAASISGYKTLKIIERIDFNQKVDSTILNELKLKYNVDGLLLLIKMYEAPSYEIIEGRSLACIKCPKNYFFKFHIIINTSWEYFDFNSGKTYDYFIENEKEESWSYDIHEAPNYNSNMLKVKEELLFNNGQISSKKLIGL